MIWHSSSVEEIVEYYNSNTENGLNSKQVAEYKKKYGKNVINPVENKSLGKCFLAKLATPTFLFGALAALFYIVVDIITFFMNNDLTKTFNIPFRVPAVIIFVLLVFEFVVAFLETRVNKSIARAAKNLDCEVEVLDNGIKKKIKAKKIVPGDIIFLKEGDYIPADARLIESESLRCDESLLTGTVATVEKSHLAQCSDIEELSKRKNMIYAGCYIAFGSCKAIVTDTGSYTEKGKKLTYLMREENVVVPIQAKVKKAIAWANSAMLALAVIFFVLGIFMGRTTYNYREFVLDAVLLFAVTIPCTYSLLVAFDVVLGLRRARRKKCVVKRISKLESICASNVIICDKTGTLTQNKMKAEKVYINNKVYEVDNFAPDEVASMLKLAALTCDGDVAIDDFGREEHYGDIVETSILSAALKILKTKKAAIDNEYPRMSEIPFDSERKLKTVICLIEGKPYAIVKGTATTIIEKCNGVDKEKLAEKIKDFSKQAYRVIGIAYKQLDELPSLPSAELIENDLTFSGLIAIANLPRFDAIAELENCKKAGIKTIMLTGDVIETAYAAANKLNLLDKDSICITGEDFEKMSDEEFDEKYQNILVYSNISAEQRVRIVEKWQSKGNSVIITGDSVADALALQKADIGCGMGLSGTDFAKSASDMVIKNDSYTAIVNGIKEIKSSYLNVINSFKQMLTTGFALAITMILGVLFYKNAVMPPMNLIMAGLFFNTISIYALGFEPANKKVLKRQINKNDEILGHGFSLDVAVGVIGIVLVSLLAYYFGNIFKFGTEYCFTVYVFSVLFMSYSNRTEKGFYTVDPFKNPLLLFSIAACVCVLLIMTMIPFVVEFFTPRNFAVKFTPLQFDQIIKCALLALVAPAINEAYKLLKKRFIKM